MAWDSLVSDALGYAPRTHITVKVSLRFTSEVGSLVIAKYKTLDLVTDIEDVKDSVRVL